MARKYKKNIIIQGVLSQYKIVEEVNFGAMAVSYKAINIKDDTTVFLKKYKSPSATVPWYKDYVDYQAMLWKRIKSSEFYRSTINLVDIFEAPHPEAFNKRKRSYHQVFQFLSGVPTLKDWLQDNPNWKSRLAVSMSFLIALQNLHKIGIIHTDLKPENLLIFEHKGAFDVYIIDLDFSIIEGLRAPWHDQSGYVGTPGYMSPEHLKGHTPQKSSDIFTTSLILYELLSKSSPYIKENPNNTHIFNHDVSPPQFYDSISEDIKAQLKSILVQSLHPSPQKRPSIDQIINVFGSKKDKTTLLGYFGYTFSLLSFLFAVFYAYSYLSSGEPTLESSKQIHKETHEALRTKSAIQKKPKRLPKTLSTHIDTDSHRLESKPEKTPVQEELKEEEEHNEESVLKIHYKTLEIHGHKPKEDKFVFWGSFCSQDDIHKQLHIHLQKSPFNLSGYFEAQIDINKTIPKNPKKLIDRKFFKKGIELKHVSWRTSPAPQKEKSMHKELLEIIELSLISCVYNKVSPKTTISVKKFRLTIDYSP